MAVAETRLFGSSVHASQELQCLQENLKAIYILGQNDFIVSLLSLLATFLGLTLAARPGGEHRWAMLSLVAILYLSRQASCFSIPSNNIGLSPTFHSPRAPSDSSPRNASCSCDDRSLWDIIWSCLATIFACSWVAVHPNIPAPNTSWLRGALARVELMIWTIIAPETMILWAIRQWIGARTLSKKYKEHGWTMTHGHFLQMGGFALHRAPSRGGQTLGVLSPEGLEYLSSKNRITFPTITADDIKDRSKGDSLSKAIALGQSLWFLAQCVTRPAQGLVTTELELVTLAFAALNGFMYFFWWHKPLDVEVQVPVYLLNPKDDAGYDRHIADFEEKKREKAERKVTFSSILESIFATPIITIFHRLRDMSDATQTAQSKQIPSGVRAAPTYYALRMPYLQTRNVIICASLIGVLFGAIHVAGWNFAFQTPAERTVWRVASLIILCVPAGMIPVQLLSVGEWADKRVEKALDMIAVVPSIFLAYVGLPAYILARVAILVLALMELRNLPDNALREVDWTSFLPHV